MPVIPEGRLRKEDHQFKISLNNEILSLRDESTNSSENRMHSLACWNMPVTPVLGGGGAVKRKVNLRPA